MDIFRMQIEKGDLQKCLEEEPPAAAEEQSHGEGGRRSCESHGEEEGEGAERDRARRERDGRLHLAGRNPRLRRVSESSSRCDADSVEDSAGSQEEPYAESAVR
uniref:Uncharacterized protein n=1 Tax=Arundo donax TaxID=35708 RepID=A0A0A9C998_ARUDO